MIGQVQRTLPERGIETNTELEQTNTMLSRTLLPVLKAVREGLNKVIGMIDDGALEIGGAFILTGPDAPTISAPDGSIYLRTAGPTALYARRSGAWVLVA